MHIELGKPFLSGPGFVVGGHVERGKGLKVESTLQCGKTRRAVLDNSLMTFFSVYYTKVHSWTHNQGYCNFMSVSVFKRLGAHQDAQKPHFDRINIT